MERGFHLLPVETQRVRQITSQAQEQPGLFLPTGHGICAGMPSSCGTGPEVNRVAHCPQPLAAFLACEDVKCVTILWYMPNSS